jgi:hypothetical protein
MEVDWSATEEVKETSDGTLLTAGGSSHGGSEDFPMQIDAGQRQISWCAYWGLLGQPMLTDASMSCACWCIGAPWRAVAPRSRVTPNGRAACEECGRELSKCKGKLYKHDPGKICQQCYDGTRRNTPMLSVPVAPVRSHKRKHPPAGQNSSSIPAIRIAPPPIPLVLPLQQQGWKLHAASRTSRALCTSWLHLAEDNELKQWELKRGGYYQHETERSLTCSFLDEKRARLRHSADRVARDLLCKSGVEPSFLKLAAIKLLRAFKGDGEQIVHFDIIEYDLATQCYTVIFYLTDTISTAVPIAPLADLRDCFTEGEKHPSPSAKAKLVDEKLHTKRVTAGSSMIINCACPHRGKANPDERTRFVLFLNYYPSQMKAPDTEEQRYPHGVRD